MTKFIISVIICVAALLHTGTEAARAPNITKSFQSNGTNPAVVRIEATGYLTITIERNILNVQKAFSQDNKIKACKLIIDPFEDAIIGPARTTIFQKSLILWGVRNFEVIDEIKIVRYTMLIVDPEQCSYKPINLPTDEVPITYPNLEPEVAPVPHPTYGMALNIFFPTLKKCAPCQYYPKDESVTKLPNQVQPPVMGPKSMHLRPFGEMNNQINNGYLMAYNYGIGTTRIEYLDKNFTSYARSYLNNSIDATSVVLSAAGRQNFAGCWYQGDDQITCQRFDSRLRPTISYQARGDSVAMLFDKNENAFIAAAKKSGGIHFWIYNALGKLVDEFVLGAVGNTARDIKIDGFLDYVDRPATEYCVSVVEFQEGDDARAEYNIKCVDVRQYTSQPGII